MTSHQLYGDSSHHLEIRATGVEYLRKNPDGDSLTDAMNLKIHVIESSESFAEITINEGTSFVQHPRSIYLGHIGKTTCIYFASAFGNKCHANCK